MNEKGLDRYVTDEQRSSRSIFNATLRAAASRLFFRVARRRTAGEADSSALNSGTFFIRKRSFGRDSRMNRNRLPWVQADEPQESVTSWNESCPDRPRFCRPIPYTIFSKTAIS